VCLNDLIVQIICDNYNYQNDMVLIQASKGVNESPDSLNNIRRYIGGNGRQIDN
jgi:hypothetical protein